MKGNLANKGEVARSRPVAHPAVVLTEGDVQHPMQRVLNAPVPADRPHQDGGIIVAAREKVADLGPDRAGAVDAPDRLDRQNRTQVRPAVQGLEILDRRGHEDAPAVQAAVPLVKGVEHWPPLASPTKAGALEMRAHSPKGAAVIGLEYQEVVGALARICPAMSFWQPIASSVTMQPSRCKVSSNAGIAAISFDLASTARWPSASP